MAIVNCKECQKEMADNAEKCPHCGHNPFEGWQFLVSLAAVIFLVGLGAGFWGA